MHQSGTNYRHNPRLAFLGPENPTTPLHFLEVTSHFPSAGKRTEEECEPGRESGRSGLGPQIDNFKLLASV